MSNTRGGSVYFIHSFTVQGARWIHCHRRLYSGDERIVSSVAAQSAPAGMMSEPSWRVNKGLPLGTQGIAARGLCSADNNAAKTL